MNKTTFKTNLIKSGFTCLKFKNDMIFENMNFPNILINIYKSGSTWEIYIYNDNNNTYDLFNKLDLFGCFNCILNYFNELYYFNTP